MKAIIKNKNAAIATKFGLKYLYQHIITRINKKANK